MYGTGMKPRILCCYVFWTLTQQDQYYQIRRNIVGASLRLVGWCISDRCSMSSSIPLMKTSLRLLESFSICPLSIVCLSVVISCTKRCRKAHYTSYLSVMLLCQLRSLKYNQKLDWMNTIGCQFHSAGWSLDLVPKLAGKTRVNSVILLEKL